MGRKGSYLIRHTFAPLPPMENMALSSWDLPILTVPILFRDTKQERVLEIANEIKELGIELQEIGVLE